MEGADALGLIAEVGIAIAGFAGVVAALRAQGGRIGAYEAMRIGTLLGVSAEAVLLSLLPFALHFAGLGTEMVWTLSSFAMFVLLGTFQVAMFRIGSRVWPTTDDHGPTMPTASAYGAAILVAVNVLQIANAALIHQLWPFYVGLLTITAHALFVFAFTLFVPSKAGVPA